MVASPYQQTDASSHLRALNIVHDLPAVADLVEACFSDTMDAEGHRYIQQMRRAGRDNAFLRWASTAIETVSMPLSGYVWVEDGTIIGNVSLIPFRQQRSKVYLIANVAVRPEFRRRGIGEALTEAAMQHARQRQAKETWLHVREDNPGAVALYRQMGFVELARRSTWQGRPDRNANLDGLGINIMSTVSRDWVKEEAWLQRIYPAQHTWYLSVPWKTLRPGFGPALYRLFMDSESKSWAVRKDGDLQAAITWQPVYGASDRLWAAYPPEGSDQALTALLLHARRTLIWRQNLSLDLPAGEYASAIEAAGFHLHRTLLWMRAAETSGDALRTST